MTRFWWWWRLWAACLVLACTALGTWDAWTGRTLYTVNAAICLVVNLAVMIFSWRQLRRSR